MFPVGIGACRRIATRKIAQSFCQSTLVWADTRQVPWRMRRDPSFVLLIFLKTDFDLTSDEYDFCYACFSYLIFVERINDLLKNNNFLFRVFVLMIWMSKFQMTKLSTMQNKIQNGVFGQSKNIITKKIGSDNARVWSFPALFHARCCLWFFYLHCSDKDEETRSSFQYAPLY